jgi:hypothetical protein
MEGAAAGRQAAPQPEGFVPVPRSLEVECKNMVTAFRWHATVTYRSEAGLVPVEHDLKEIGDLDRLIELGPHWDTIVSIDIKRVNHNTSPTLTIEEAKKL